jgi:hypothetical protein
VYDITLTYQQLLCFFTADIRFQFHLSLQCSAVMATTNKGLFAEDNEQALSEELQDSEPSD